MSGSCNKKKTGMGGKSGMLVYRQPCWQCRGLGYIGQPKADTTMQHMGLLTASEDGSTGYSNQAAGRTSHPGSGPGSSSSMSSSTSDEDDEEIDEEEEDDDEGEDEVSWFKKNKLLVLLIGGGALLIVVLVLSQSSKK